MEEAERANLLMSQKMIIDESVRLTGSLRESRYTGLSTGKTWLAEMARGDHENNVRSEMDVPRCYVLHAVNDSRYPGTYSTRNLAPRSERTNEADMSEGGRYVSLRPPPSLDVQNQGKK
jgi:hypothetical protein